MVSRSQARVRVTVHTMLRVRVCTRACVSAACAPAGARGVSGSRSVCRACGRGGTWVPSGCGRHARGRLGPSRNVPVRRVAAPEPAQGCREDPGQPRPRPGTPRARSSPAHPGAFVCF